MLHLLIGYYLSGQISMFAVWGLDLPNLVCSLNIMCDHCSENKETIFHALSLAVTILSLLHSHPQSNASQSAFDFTGSKRSEHTKRHQQTEPSALLYWVSLRTSCFAVFTIPDQTGRGECSKGHRITEPLIVLRHSVLCSRSSITFVNVVTELFVNVTAADLQFDFHLSISVVDSHLINSVRCSIL